VISRKENMIAKTRIFNPIRSALLSGVLIFLSTGGVIGQESLPSDTFEEIDLESFVFADSKLGNTAFRRGELYMRAKRPDDFFYVVVATEEFSIAGRSASVSIRNVKGLRTGLGYGLVFHSEAKPLEKGYVFAIDTITGRYRVARHELNEEIPVILWTKSRFILRGKRRNVLEVKDRGKYVDLFINGQFVRSLDTPFGSESKLPGLYTDATPIAARQLQVRGTFPPAETGTER
jgi:hypothetical protein